MTASADLQPGVFELVAPYAPAGDQPTAIDALARGVAEGRAEQVLMGVTGSGKTFTMANVIARVGRPTLVLSHNKTLAAQLYAEFRDFFPHNAVLEASGGIRLDTVAALAATGVDRVSTGWPTHDAPWLDVAPARPGRRRRR